MAYYDALVAKWATLSGPSPSSDKVQAAIAVAAEPAPVAPEGPQPDDAWAAFDTAAQAHHQAYASLFAEPEVVAKLAAINALNVAGPRRLVPIVQAMDYLRANSLWLPIKLAASSKMSAAAVVDLNEDPRAQSIDFDLPVVQGLLAELVSDGLLSQDQANALEGLSHTATPWWQDAGYTSPISGSDLEAVLIATGGALV